MIFLGLNRTIDPGCTPVHGLAEILSSAAPTVAGANGAELSQFRPRGGAPTTEPQLAGKAGDLINKPASMFSGAMRLLLQDYYSKCVDAAVPYSFGYSKTHGVMLTSDGAPWIIEIDIAQGVRAIRLEATGSLTQYATAPTDKNAFRFEPIIAPLPPVADPSWRLLADAPSLFGSLEGAPHYGEGWAFNADGSRAAIVLIGTQGLYWYTRLYELTFVEGNASIATPAGPVNIRAPTSATLAVREEGYLWQALDGTDTRLKRPNGAGPMGVQVHSRDDLSRGQLGPPQSSSVCPVYCYYKGDALQVARWHHETLTTDPGPPSVSTATACYSTPSAGVMLETAKVGSEVTHEKGQQLSGWMEGANASGSNNLVAATNIIAKWAYENPYAWIEKRRSGVADSTTVRDCLVLPILDREAMYHERRVRTVLSDTDSSTTFLNWRADGQRAHSYRSPGTPTTGSAVPANQRIAIVLPTALAAPFNFGGTFTLFETEIERAGEYFDFDADGNLIARDTSFEVADEMAKRYAAERPEIAAASANAIVSTVTKQEITRDLWNFLLTRTAGNVHVADSIGRYGFVQVTKSPLAIYGPPTAPVADPDEVNPGASTNDTTITAYVDGSVVGASWTLSEAEHAEWQRKTGEFSGQEWIVAQDANSGGQNLYYDQPRPFGGTIGEVTKGSATYSPGALASQLWAWIGKP